MKVVTYGSGPASDLLRNYRPDSVRWSGHIGRQSLISAMNGPCRDLQLPAAAIERVVQEDIRSSLTEVLEGSAASADLLIWDIVDERFGVATAPHSTYLTRSPQLKKSGLRLPSSSAVVPFGTDEHFMLWKKASNEFSSLLEELDLLGKTVLLNLDWAETDEYGGDASLPYGLSPSEANQRYQRYVSHVEALGVRVLSVPGVVSSAHHVMGPAPFHYSDSVFHSVAVKLQQFAEERGVSNGFPAWCWDERHETEIKTWTALEQADFTSKGRTEHLIRPSKTKGEVFPTRVLVENTGSDILLVISHGALPRNKYTVPRFEWMATLSTREENRLFLSDTTLEDHDDLELAWFTGSTRDDLTSRYADLVRETARQLGASKIVFMGGSGGGFASLSLAAKVPGSRALVFNPQTIIRSYWNRSVDQFQKALFPELENRSSISKLGSRADATLLPAPSSHQIIYVQNDDDAHHVEKHLTPFAKKNGLAVRTGLSDDGRISIVLEHFTAGHNMPYREVLLDFVDIAVSGWDKPLPDWHDFPPSPLTMAYRGTQPYEMRAQGAAK